MEYTPGQHATFISAFCLMDKELRDAGYDWRIGTDFELARHEIGYAGKELTPFFWTENFDFNGENAFYLALEKDGEGQAFICTQLFELGRRSFSDAYVQRLKAIFSHDSAARLDTSWRCDPMDEVTGTVAYSGDVVTRKDLRLGGKSRRYLSNLAKIALCHTMTYWNHVDWVVGSIEDHDVSRGLGWLYGANRCYQMAEKWDVLPEGRNANYALVASSRKELLYNARAEIARHQSVQRGLKQNASPEPL